MKGLVVKSPYIDDILRGDKIWEVRGSNTNFRGKVILLKSGTGLAFGSVEIYDSIEIDLKQYNEWEYRRKNNKPIIDVLPYKRTYKWLLKNPCIFDEPIPYKHPSGAIIWVNLPDDFLEGKGEI